MEHDKKDKRANHLKNQKSPYLRQHMYNLVDWFPWSEEAFHIAKDENKLIFLSIGYSTCHWCHVMAHESFDDPDTSDFLNKHFISIKVDREERPDIDQIYQHIIQLTGRSGGWPLSIFMTPDKKPFYAGTYFPVKPKYGMISFIELLQKIVKVYNENNDEIIESADAIINTLKQYAAKTDGFSYDGDLPKNMMDRAVVNLEKLFDTQNGGFGTAPKFPNFPTLLFAIRHIGEKEIGQSDSIQNLKDFVELTLDHMADGGIYDHIGGGFARYSVDAHWIVPHFEKMLYDNAMALNVYSEAYKVYKKARYKEVVKETIKWLKNDMYHLKQGFYSAMDADSDGDEGKFYVWTQLELTKILPEEYHQIFFTAYGVTRSGNFEHNQNILNRVVSNIDLASKFSKNLEEVDAILKNCRDLLINTRKMRVYPSIDTKILTAWNALLIHGLFDAFQILNDDSVRDLAHNTVLFLTNTLYDRNSKILYSVFDPVSQESSNAGTLDTYAYLIQCLFDDFLFYPNESTLHLIKDLITSTINQFWDSKEDGFFYSSILSKDLLVRMKNGSDMPLPSPNGVMAENLLQIFYYNGEESYFDMAEKTLKIYISSAIRNPTGYGAYLMAAQWYFFGSIDIAVISNERLKTNEFLKKICRYYLPRAHIFFETKNLPSLFATLQKQNLSTTKTFYLCFNFNCLPPQSEEDAFFKTMQENFLSI